MKREQALKRRLQSLHALTEAVGAMKSLSARHYRELRGVVEPARSYRQGVERILAATGAELPAGSGSAGLLVIGAELGLCGGYNSAVVAAAAEHRAALGDGPTVCSGARAATLLKRQGVSVTQTYNAPTSIGGISEYLLRLAEDLLTSYVSNSLSSFDILSTRFAGIGAQQPSVLRLLPIASRRTDRGPVVRYVSAAALSFAAIREYLYIAVHDLLIDALTAEHSARLIATEAAEEWLGERREQVRKHLAATRREQSTQEVIEISAGARSRQRRDG